MVISNWVALVATCCSSVGGLLLTILFLLSEGGRSCSHIGLLFCVRGSGLSHKIVISAQFRELLLLTFRHP